MAPKDLKKRISGLKINQPIVVSWLDAACRTGWHENTNERPPIIHTLGFYQKAGKEMLALSQCIDNTNDSFNNTFFIPYGMIRDIRRP